MTRYAWDIYMIGSDGEERHFHGGTGTDLEILQMLLSQLVVAERSIPLGADTSAWWVNDLPEGAHRLARIEIRPDRRLAERLRTEGRV